MGKSSRIKVERAGQRANALGNYKKKEGMPNWAVNLIAIVVTVAILLSGLLLVLSSNGTILRSRTAIRSEHFRVNGQMMTYYANVQYQNFLTNYSSILSSFSLDTEKPLKDQKFGDTEAKPNNYDALYLQTPEGFEGTWHDYFMLEAEEEVKNLLLYCEEAYKLGVTLGAGENQKIDEAIASIEAAATSYGYPLNSYISATFGDGVKEKDLRRAMELSELATLGMNALSDKLMGEVGADRINAAYNADPSKYNQIDYSFYSFRVDYADISTDMKAANANVTDAEILAQYKLKITEAKVKAEALLATADNTAFEKFIMTELATDEYDAQMEKKTLPDTAKPTDEQLALIKSGMIAQAVTEIMSGTTADKAVKQEGEKYVGYTVEMTKEYADLFNSVKIEIDDTLKANEDGYVKDKVDYVDSDAFSTWAFDAARAAGDTHKILTGDGSDETAEITREKGYFRVDVYRLRTPQYKNTELTRDLAYMVFSSKESAQAAIDALKAEAALDQATFERIAEEKKGTFDVLESYVEGDMGNESFDAWVFADGRAVGNFTETPLTLGESSFVVLYYTAEGDEAWYAAVHDALFDEDFKTYYDGVAQSIEIKVKAGTLKKVKIGA